MRRIAFLTGSRGEWGYIRPILRIIQADADLDYSIIATNMHLLSGFGMSVDEIEGDGFRVDERVFMTLDGYTGATMAKSLGLLLLELPGVLQRLQPDVVVLAGDRGEQLMGAIACIHLGIPVAHIQAGELTGNVDGTVRHAITKLAHIHFAANDEFAQRVLRLGEQPFRVVVSGAPLVDELIAGPVATADELAARHRFDPHVPFALVVQHPVTEEEEASGAQVAETVHALAEVDLPAFFIYPNADAGSEAIRIELDRLRRPGFRFFRNLPRADYLGLMKQAAVMVGNSSSGVMEAPSFGTPAVNIGRRQTGRMQASNVINADYDRHSIAAAIRKAVTDEFRREASLATNPYGDGMASSRIVETLRNLEIDGTLLNKEMAY
jgi:UDP-hydrolysing UDP-N-acetyl-D-glucosamine 2-epimerase